MLNAAAGYPNHIPVQPSFQDVPPDYFAYGAIESLYHMAIISGSPCPYQAGACFSPSRPMLRGEVSKLLHYATESKP